MRSVDLSANSSMVATFPQLACFHYILSHETELRYSMAVRICTRSIDV
jgi:hypothetical protein